MSKTFNVCYLREYSDPEVGGEYFYSYETVYRNVPMKFKKKFNEKTKQKMVKFLDTNFKETAENYQNISKVELIDEEQYYTTYEDMWPIEAEGDRKMWQDYGQQYDRQSLRKDYNKKLTNRNVLNYNDKRLN